MPYFINTCRSCLSNDNPANEYLFKKEQDYNNPCNYFQQLQAIYPDLRLDSNLPFQLCYDCQSWMWEANRMIQYINFQIENERCQKLLIKDSICSGCLENCLDLFDKATDVNESNDFCNKTYIDILMTVYPLYQIEAHISHKYCKNCCKCIKSLYLLRKLLMTNNALYANYCSMLTSGSSDVKFSSLIINITKAVDYSNSNTKLTFIKEEIDIENTCMHIKCENDFDKSNNLLESSNETKCDQYTFYNEWSMQWKESSDSEIKPIVQIKERLHNKEMPYKCNKCNKSFACKTSMKKHNTIHTKIRYKCNTCQKSFKFACELKKHQRIHTGVKPYECDVCQKSFFERNKLKKHKIIHTGDKPYKCDVCQKSFNQTIHLKLHQRVHTGEKPYKCNLCDKSFRLSHHLKRHQLSLKVH